MVSGGCVFKIKRLCLRTDFRLILIHTSSIRNKALHDLTLTKMAIARFVGTGSSVIMYCNGHKKYIYRQLQKFLDYNLKTLFL